uniref:Uncharacterized protein n=1 Tax=Rhizophora mucronata TaxID=61149 RepID=A0A2P2PIT0_RHIMU
MKLIPFYFVFYFHPVCFHNFMRWLLSKCH